MLQAKKFFKSPNGETLDDSLMGILRFVNRYDLFDPKSCIF